MFELTFTAKVKEFVEEKYSEANIILEYGSGGSTVLALSLKKQVITIESDLAWLNRLRDHLQNENLIDNFTGIHPDIGPTKEWGHPSNSGDYFQRFPTYALSPWTTNNYNPDTVLIDGRFRVACFVACAAMTEKPLTILFDDYADRSHYHLIERIFRKEFSIDRMAVFKIQPNSIGAADLCHFIPYFVNAS